MSSRKIEAFKKWIPIAAISALIVFVILILVGIPLERAIASSGLIVLLIFSGFLFRSHGKEKDRFNSQK